MLVIAAPGQGAQTPGFLAPWLELPGFADRLQAWSELSGCDLIRCGTAADADEIRDTAIAQPLLVAAAIAATDQVVTGAHPVSRQSVGVAGHSVGELAAGALAEVITPEDAMRLVRVRAHGMAAAAAAEQTGMTAVLGGDEGAVLAAIEAHGLTPAAAAVGSRRFPHPSHGTGRRRARGRGRRAASPGPGPAAAVQPRRRR